CARETGHKPRFLATGGQKLRWCPEIRAGAEKLATAINSNRRSAPPLSLFHSLITKRRQTNQ
ncbi:MAG: hypothetical protein QM296_06580, partial [Bacillota bacterium]|nr:hypothetical protein [Bacillota bacterium]